MGWQTKNSTLQQLQYLETSVDWFIISNINNTSRCLNWLKIPGAGDKKSPANTF